MEAPSSPLSSGCWWPAPSLTSSFSFLSCCLFSCTQKRELLMFSEQRLVVLAAGMSCACEEGSLAKLGQIYERCPGARPQGGCAWCLPACPQGQHPCTWVEGTRMGQNLSGTERCKERGQQGSGQGAAPSHGRFALPDVRGAGHTKEGVSPSYVPNFRYPGCHVTLSILHKSALGFCMCFSTASCGKKSVISDCHSANKHGSGGVLPMKSMEGKV